MTRDEAIKLAEEANIGTYINLESYLVGSHLERFATLVAAAEREACANVCDSYDVADDVCSSDTAEGIAIAIRARGQS